MNNRRFHRGAASFLLTACLLLAASAAALSRASAEEPVSKSPASPTPGKRADPVLASSLKTLEQHGVEPSAAGARRFLRELLPGPNQQAQIQRLISQLDDAEYARREAATMQLLRMPSVPIEALGKAAQNGDAETRWRARLILEQAERESAHVVQAALKVAATEPADDVIADVFAVLPLCRQGYLLDAAQQALGKLARPRDVVLLRGKLAAGGDPRVRVAAVVALAAALAPERIGELCPLLDDPNQRVALEAAKALGNAGDRAALGPLVRLLESSDTQIRAESAMMLQGLTGQHHDYAAYLPDEQRAAAVARWKTWLVDEGRSAQLHFPVLRDHSARGSLNGNTLIATGSGRRVFELTPAGKIVFEYAMDSWSAEKLQNGNVLIASYAQNRVSEVDPTGKEVWFVDGISAMTAKPLHNGNYLVADFSGRRAVEISRQDKQIKWVYETPDECFDADRLPNGNTLVGCPNVIQEVRPDGETVREWTIAGRLNGFQALPNGNLIVANYGANKVYELTPDGETVWEFEEPQPCDVFRLPDGSMLVSTGSRVIEVSADRKTVREICKAQYGSARR